MTKAYRPRLTAPLTAVDALRETSTGQDRASQQKHVSCLEPAWALKAGYRIVEGNEGPKIAAFLKHSLFHGELGHIQEKTLLSLLANLNNAQNIILKFHAFHSRTDEYRAFYERHRSVLMPPAAVIGASEEDVDQNAMHGVYRNELQRLGLLQPKFKTPNKKGELPEMDPDTGMIKVASVKITRLGRLLLRYIELEEPEV